MTRALGVFLRLLVALALLELSGFARLTEIGCADHAEDVECCGDCPLEQQDKHCPPGCAGCHCSHGSLVLPGLGGVASLGPDPGAAMEQPLPFEASVPRAPPSRGVYRPPRPAALELRFG